MERILDIGIVSSVPSARRIFARPAWLTPKNELLARTVPSFSIIRSADTSAKPLNAMKNNTANISLDQPLIDKGNANVRRVIMSSEPEIITPEEVEGVYQKYKQDLWKFLLSLCRDSDEAADLFQGVFLKIVEKSKTGYIQRSTLRSFLFTLTYNHFIDSRRTRRWEQPGGDALTVAVPDRGIDESERILTVIYEVLENNKDLPGRSRDVLRLRFLAGMNITDITRVMRISRPTVYSDLAAALGVLRGEFEARGLTPELLGDSGS